MLTVDTQNQPSNHRKKLTCAEVCVEVAELHASEDVDVLGVVEGDVCVALDGSGDNTLIINFKI